MEPEGSKSKSLQGCDVGPTAMVMARSEHLKGKILLIHEYGTSHQSQAQNLGGVSLKHLVINWFGE